MNNFFFLKYELIGKMGISGIDAEAGRGNRLDANRYYFWAIGSYGPNVKTPYINLGRYKSPLLRESVPQLVSPLSIPNISFFIRQRPHTTPPNYFN